jgi:hypothetical protein
MLSVFMSFKYIPLLCILFKAIIGLIINDKKSIVAEPLRNDYPSLQERFFNRAANNPEHPPSNVSFNNKPAIKEQVRHDVFSNVLHERKPNPEYTHDIYIEEVKNKKIRQDKFVFYATGFGLKTNTGEKSILIDAHLAENDRNILLIENHIEF